MKVVLIGPMNFRAIMSLSARLGFHLEREKRPGVLSKAMLQLPTAAEAQEPLGDTHLIILGL